MMDINTEAGQVSLHDERRAAMMFEAAHPGLVYVETPKDQPVRVDAVISKGSQIVAVVETKCRYDVTLHEFFDRYLGEWLVTFEKLVAARDIASALCVPLYGFLYLQPSRHLLIKQLTDKSGQWVCDMKIRHTATQKTINGGEAVRANSYVVMKGCKILHPQGVC